MTGEAYAATRARPDGARTRLPGGTTPSPSGPLLLAAGCVGGLALVWCLAELVPAIHVRDGVLLGDFVRLSSPHLNQVLRSILHLLDPSLYILWGVALVALALARSRPRVALAIAVVLGAAPLAAEVLKPLLQHGDAGYRATQLGISSWPSGHATAALTLALCAVLAVPARWRALTAAIGLLFAAVVGAGLLILAKHMPSDVVGGYLIATLWIALAVAALRAAELRWPSRRPAPAGEVP
ncbi:MAG TPA: phosphatase PAP2 family protein [Solirubrobacteraceae bacterium]|nr:phosphatase PAP2 family protein [Solirubrobacteraceae bacterium]